jgi:hypothetical protein
MKRFTDAYAPSGSNRNKGREEEMCKESMITKFKILSNYALFDRN